MQLPPSDYLAALPVLALGRGMADGNLSVVGLCMSMTCIGLVAFSFMRKKPKKEKAPQESTPVEDWVEMSPAPQGDADIDQLLSQIRYPLTDRGRLVKALGGEDAEVEIGISRALPAGEVADRCFSIAQRFTSKGQVLEALDKASWITSVMSGLNMAPFPLRSASDIPKALARGYIEGVKVKDLLDRVEFPIENASDLLARLSEARFGRARSADGDRGRKADHPETKVPQKEADEESEALLAHARISGGNESDMPEEIPG